MIIDDLNFERVAVTPYEADPILIVNPNAVLSRAVALKLLQAIPGKYRKIRKLSGGMNLDKLSLNDVRKPVKPPRKSALKDQLSIFGSKRSNHALDCMTLYVMRQGCVYAKDWFGFQTSSDSSGGRTFSGSTLTIFPRPCRLTRIRRRDLQTRTITPGTA